MADAAASVGDGGAGVSVGRLEEGKEPLWRMCGTVSAKMGESRVGVKLTDFGLACPGGTVAM